MTSDILFDSCVLAKIVISEPDSALAETLVQSLLSQGLTIRVLDLALIEVGNVIWKTWRRKLIDTIEAEEAIKNLMVTQAKVEPALPFLARSLQLAMKYQIAVYDALFVAAVDQWDCRGVTSDATLVQRVQKDFPGIELLK